LRDKLAGVVRSSDHAKQLPFSLIYTVTCYYRLIEAIREGTMSDEESRRGAIAKAMFDYLVYVNEHKSDDGFVGVPAGERALLRRAAKDGGFIMETPTGLELTETARRQLREAGAQF
jgi:hypothetical protein